MTKNRIVQVYPFCTFFTHFTFFILTVLFLPLVGCSTEAQSQEEIQRSKALSSEGMKIVERWDGKNEDIENANKLFQKALSFNPKNPEAFAGLGEIELTRWYGGDQYKEKSLETALEYAKRALSIDGGNEGHFPYSLQKMPAAADNIH